MASVELLQSVETGLSSQTTAKGEVVTSHYVELLCTAVILYSCSSVSLQKILTRWLREMSLEEFWTTVEVVGYPVLVF